MGIEVKIEGLKQVISRIDSLKVDGMALRDVVKKNGANLQQETQKNMVKAYIKGYSHGYTKGSTNLEITDNGKTAIVAPHSEYFPYVEYGTRFMDPEPALGPAFNKVKQQFYKDIKDTLSNK